MTKWIYVAGLLFYVGAVLCCKNGEKERINEGPCRLMICLNGSWTLEECSNEVAISMEDDEPERLTSKCRSDESIGFFGSPYYYVCWKGRLQLRRCVDGMFYETKAKKCIMMPNDEEIQGCPKDTLYDPKKQKCVKPPYYVKNAFVTKLAQCNHGETRKKEGSCKTYYECRHGREIVARCMDCQNYDEKEKKCRYVFDSPCRSHFPEPSITTYPLDVLTTAEPGERSSDPTPTGSTESTTESTDTSTKITGSSPVPDNEDMTTFVPGKWTTDPTPTTGTISSPTEVIGTSTRITNDGGSSSSTTQASDGVPTTPITPVTQSSGSSEPGSTALPFGDCKKRRALPDCKYFLECHEGELVTRKCGWLQYFDSKTSTCSYMGYKCLGTE